MKIAVAGKGGTGKTTVSAMLVRLLRERAQGNILGVDADPSSNLGDALGLRPAKTIGQVIDAIAKNPDRIPGGMTKDRFIEYEVQTIVEEGEGFDLLTMGKPEGPGCYCYVNNVLRGALETLVKGYDFSVIDNEAGLEHLSRKTTGTADVLLVVSDPSAAGLRAAKRINQLADELKLSFARRLLLINRGAVELRNLEPGIEACGSVPEDPEVARMGRENRSVFTLDASSPSLRAAERVLRKILGTSKGDDKQ